MYKKIILTLSFFAFSTIAIFSQNHIEALRYSQQFYSGSAKSEAMGNSLSAVGADFSSFITNPAGIAIYKSNHFSFTPNFIVNTTRGTLSGNTKKDGKIGFNFSNAGYVSVHEFNGILKSFTIGISYNSFNDFRQKISLSAENQNQSYLDYLVYNANNNRYNDLREGVAYDAWLLDKDDEGYYSWVTEKKKYGNSQRKTISTKGGSGEFTFALGFNINDILYLGGSVGLTSINYSYSSTLTEENYIALYHPDDNNPGDSIQVNPDKLNFTEDLITDGSGVNAKFGFIFQPIKMLRFGASVHSSTAYDIEENYMTSMKSKFPIADDDGNFGYDVYSETNVFAYRLNTPIRANAGIAIILDAYKIGNYYTTPMILSADYEYVDYSTSNLRAASNDSYSFDNEVENIKSFYRETHNFRAGAEFNFGVMKIRTGFSLYSSPFKNEDMFKNAKTTFSSGIGFANDNSFIDLSYSYSPNFETVNLYNATDIYPSNPIGNLKEPKANIYSSKQFFKVTLGLKL